MSPKYTKEEKQQILSEVTIDFYPVSDGTQLLKLTDETYSSWLGADNLKAFYRWKYLDNPAGEALVYGAWHKEKLVSIYTALPSVLLVKGKPVKAILSCDSMTHPDYAGLGLFSTIGKKLYEYAIQKGFQLIYGFPNKNGIHPTTKKLGWKQYGDVPLMARASLSDLTSSLLFNDKLQLFSITSGWHSAANKFFNRGVSIETITEFDESFDALNEDYASPKDVTVRRDFRYLNWRYANKPGTPYKIIAARKGETLLGYAVLSEEKKIKDKFKVLYILEMIAKDHSLFAYSALISHILHHSHTQHFPFIGILASQHTMLRYSLLLHEFMPIRRKFFPQEIYFGGCCFSNDTNLVPVVENPDGWFLSWGTNDVI